MKIPDIFRHPIESFRTEPVGEGMVAVGLAALVMDAADVVFGTDLPIFESVGIANASAYILAIGALLVSSSKHRETNSPA